MSLIVPVGIHRLLGSVGRGIENLAHDLSQSLSASLVWENGWDSLCVVKDMFNTFVVSTSGVVVPNKTCGVFGSDAMRSAK